MEKLSYVDQQVNSPVLHFFTTSGYTIDVLEADILAFIDENNLNVAYEGEALTSGLYGIEAEVLTDALTYLDSHFEEVTLHYFNSVIVNNIQPTMEQNNHTKSK